MSYQFDELQVKYDEMISMGAEAKVYRSNYIGYKTITKYRLAKSYRVHQIDTRLRKSRTIQEVRLLELANSIGVPVPYVLYIDKSTWSITMTEIAGELIKHCLDHENVKSCFEEIGQLLATLHNNDIIHGDLTTSNMVYNGDKIYFIDFGLGFISNNIEDKAVDILVLEHTLRSSHVVLSKIAYSSFLDSYSKIANNSKGILKRLKVIEQRVRYK